MPRAIREKCPAKVTRAVYLLGFNYIGRGLPLTTLTYQGFEAVSWLMTAGCKYICPAMLRAFSPHKIKSHSVQTVLQGHSAEGRF